MPIKTLEPFLFENYSVGNYPIDILKNSTIGIDLTHYVSRLLTFKKEPLIEAIGGFPITLLNNMENDLKVFKELKIKPIFVIDGLSSLANFQAKNSDGLNSAEKVRANKWDLFAKNIKVDTFRDYHTPLKCNFYDIIHFLHKHDVEYIIAPYQATQQLYYMLQQNVIDTIYGSTDLLLYPLPLEKFIFCIEFQNREFKFLDKNYILNKLNLTEKQFLEISMCTGNGYQPFNLNIFQTGTDITFQQLYDFTITGGSIFNTLLQLDILQPTFFKGLSALKFLPVLNATGTVEILKISASDKLPNDLHEFVGQKLSNEYYYYQSLGITDLRIFETVLHGVYLERLSLDTQPHRFYLELLTDTELINKILNLITGSMHRYFQFKRYEAKLILPNNQTRVLDLSSRLAKPLYFDTKRFLYKDSSDAHFQISGFFENLTKGLIFHTGPAPLDNESKLQNNNELVGTSLARSLFVLDFIGDDGELTKFGALLPKIKSTETLLVLLFFAKFQNGLKAQDLGSTKFELISKMLSIYKIKDIKPQNYTGTLSKSLLQFNSIFSKLQQRLNELVVANLLTVLYNSEFANKFEYTRSDWYDLVSENPFNKAYNSVLLGVVSTAFFSAYTTNQNDLKLSIEHLNRNLGNLFTEDSTSYEVLTTGFVWFKDEVAPLVAALAEAGLANSSVAGLFKEAEEWIATNV